ncbi:DNA-directed DNA polymerase II small subunit [archaeon]|nr:DNA-directed DNA polymerase II small subunit [archaeon]
MKEKLLAFFNEKELFISPEALEALLQTEQPLENAKKIAEQPGKLFIELKDVPTSKPKITVERPANKALASQIDTRIREFDEYNITGKSASSGKIEDFISLFQSRFEQLSKILKARGNAIRDIETLKKKKPGDIVRIIGMVNSIRTTKNGHRFLIIEDLTGTLNTLIIERNKPLMRESYRIIPDEVIAIEGKLSKDLFIVNQVYFPDIPARESHKTEEDIYLAMISDMHIGSKLFMEKNFRKFLNWLNRKEGNEKQKEIAGKVKYITIAGDLVDGVGIYPGQENELETENIYEQYSKLAKLLEEIPEYIELISIPGNHDATRVAEPQPAVRKELMEDLLALPNFRMMGNPGQVSLHGVEVLMYHGASIHSMVPHIIDASYEKPEKTIAEWLKRRHLHPVYGEKPPICPEKRDYLVIDRVPDILHAGDVHKNGYITYRGIIGVNSGTWQAITPYQIKQGHAPTPCILPIVHMKTGKLSVIHFEGGLT